MITAITKSKLSHRITTDDEKNMFYVRPIYTEMYLAFFESATLFSRMGFLWAKFIFGAPVLKQRQFTQRVGEILFERNTDQSLKLCI